MKKPLAILLAFFIVFAPVYSNAVLPALAATVASNSGRVLIGQTIKKVAPQALNNARKAMVGICKANPAKCSALGIGVGGLTSAIVGDGWNIDITNNDVTNIDIDIYKIDSNPAWDGQCTAPNGYYITAAAGYWSTKVQACQSAAKYYGQTFLRLDENYYCRMLKPNGATDTWNMKGNSSCTADSGYAIDSSPVKTYITNNELNQYITNNTINNDIDIKDIYNFDFSQYNNITIGGDTYNGTTINNDLAKSDPSEADKKVSVDLKKKLDSKELSLDDVTDENCTKNEAGEYDKCGDKTDPTDPEEPTDPEPEPPPIECDANGFYKKVCDWMDWTQTKHDKPESGNVDIIDKSDGLEINENRIDFSNQCPAPTPINTSVGGFPISTELNYQPLCDFFTMLNPFVIGMGGISSALIIAGGIRRG